MDNETDFLKPEGDQGRLRTEPPPPERLLSTPDRSLPPGVPGDNRGRRSQRNTGSSTSIRIPAADVDKSGREQQEQPASNIHCITIVGQIEGHMILPPQNKTTKYEHILPQLVAIEQSPTIEGLLIVLNTVGGDVEAGLAIAEMIESMSKPSVSLVLGGGHSIAVPIAVSCDYSFIAETATMTIHPLRLSGLVIGVPQTYEYLDKMQDRVIKYVARHSNITEERFKEMMMRTGELVRDVGTVVIGKEAVEAGLINEVGGLHCALAKLEELRRVYKESLSESLSSEEASEAGEHCPGLCEEETCHKEILAMIMHTVIPLEEVFEGVDKLSNEGILEAEYEKATLIIRLIDGVDAEVIKLISSDPNDYLKPQCQPGSRIAISQLKLKKPPEYGL